MMDNSSFPITDNNISTTNGNESFIIGIFSGGPVAVLIQLPAISLTIILAFAYTALILIRPTFRSNKLNWFTVNICLASAWFSIIMLSMSVQQLLNAFGPSSCRLEALFVNMSACQFMYSHCTTAISRLLTIVYGNKRFIRSNMCLWVCIGTGWLFAFLVALPYLFADGFLCSILTQAAFLSYYTLVTTLILPVTIVAGCNLRILLFVRNSTRRVHATGAGGHVSHARDIHLLKVMVGTFTAFLVGWTPLLSTQLFNKTGSIPTILKVCFQILPPLSVLHNVIVLIYSNQPVRIYLKKLILRRPEIVQVNPIYIGHQPNVPNH